MEDDLILFKWKKTFKKYAIIANRQPEQHNNQNILAQLKKSTVIGCDKIVN
jgi:hypothetical protein